jgi:hypothetical protein
MSRKFFCTFADSRMQESLKRIESQAKALNFFDEIFIYNEDDLEPQFKEEFKHKLIKGSRGYGYKEMFERGGFIVIASNTISEG